MQMKRRAAVSYWCALHAYTGVTVAIMTTIVYVMTPILQDSQETGCLNNIAISIGV